MKSAKFKDSPLGPIPEDWEVKRLGKICDVQLGKMLDSAKNQGEECFYLTNKDVQWGRISVSDLRRMRMSEDDRQRFSLRQGDLLVCEGGEVGRCAIWNSEVEGCCFQKTIHRVRANVSDTIDMRFLQPLLCVYAKKGVFDPYISCTSIAHLTKEKFELLEIICPPLPEQQRIAEALGEVDKLIESLDEQVEKKRLIAKGVAHDLLSGKKRLPGFKGEWKTRSIEDMLTLGHGRDYKGIPNGDVPVYGTGGVMCHVAECLYEGPTVCIGRKGTIDAPIYHEGKIWTVDTLFYSHSFNECYPKFIYYKFLAIDWQSYNEASGVPSLTADIIGRI